jgi:toxin HigB-1
VWYHDVIPHLHDPELQGKIRRSNPDRATRTERFPSDLLSVARRKLVQLNAVVLLRDLSVPPGNRLEALKGDLKGKHSIRINDQ